MLIKSIVAVDKNWAIGNDGDLIEYDKRDMKHFTDTTRGNIIVMGRKTFESIGVPLKLRDNYVLTRDPEWSACGVTACGSLDDVFSAIKENGCTYTDEPIVYIIGGAEIYRLAMPYVDECIVTHLDIEVEPADTFFPVDALSGDDWNITKREFLGSLMDAPMVSTYSRGPQNKKLLDIVL